MAEVDATVIGAMAAVAAIVIATIFWIILRPTTKAADPSSAAAETTTATATAGSAVSSAGATAAGVERRRGDRSALGRLARGGGDMRSGGNNAIADDGVAARVATDAGVGENPDDDEAGDDEESATGTKRLGKKKLDKLQRKEEERKHREWVEAQRADAKRRDALIDEERRARHEEQERRDRLEAEAEAKRLAEIKEQEEAEYALLKQSIVVEETGTEAQDAEQTNALLQRIVTYIKDTKVVMLEELASEFCIKTTEAAKHLRELDSCGAITGVLDDRGKYIYVSPSELAHVADFIRQRGRISRSELAAMSNRLIDLNPQRQVQSFQDQLFEGELDAEITAPPPLVSATST